MNGHDADRSLRTRWTTALVPTEPVCAILPLPCVVGQTSSLNYVKLPGTAYEKLISWSLTL